jgi:hypothetical protein
MWVDVVAAVLPGGVLELLCRLRRGSFEKLRGVRRVVFGPQPMPRRPGAFFPFREFFCGFVVRLVGRRSLKNRMWPRGFGLSFGDALPLFLSL